MRGYLAPLVTFWLSGGIALAGNPLLDELTTQGVQLGAQSPEDGPAAVKLPPPTMPDGLDRAAQEAVIRKVAARHPLERFLRKSVVAPMVISRQSIKDTSGKRGHHPEVRWHRVDVFFAAHGRLATIAGEELLEQLNVAPASKTGLPSENRLLSKEELSRKDLLAEPTPACRQKYSCFSASVLNRVYVTGVSRAVQTRTEGSILAAVKIDPRFDADWANTDAKLSNRWRSIVRSPSGAYKLGPPRPYAAFGAYAKATALVDSAGEPTPVIFIEGHMVFAEPEGWFDGRNLLAPKLPPAVQEEVRRFRRKLALFEKKSK